MTAPLLSACLIVRDEEKNLPRCLESLRGWVDTVHIEDTGSEDRTVQIARELGAEVHHNPWQRSFCLHRNSVFARARGRFVLTIDADEEVVETDTAETRARLAEDRGLPDVLLVRNILRYPLGRRLSVYVPRILRRSSGFRWVFPIHEQLDADDAPAAPTNVTLMHHGYAEPGALEAKERRNLAIAEAMEPRGVHALHCIVRSAFYLRQWEKTVATAYQLLSVCRNPTLVEEACALGAAAAVNVRDTAAVTYLTAYGLALSPQNPDLLMMQSVATLGRYLHGLRDGDSTAGGSTMRPPLFWHDAANVRSAIQSVLGATLGGDPVSAGPESTAPVSVSPKEAPLLNPQGDVTWPKS